MLTILAFWRLRQEDHSKSEAILGYMSSRLALVQCETLPQKGGGAGAGRDKDHAVGKVLAI